MKQNWDYVTPGIPDDLFTRGEVPMTKEEVRVVTLAKARLAPGQVVWDIGSGTGSLAIEAARLIPGGQVYAIEQNQAGVELIRENVRRFSLTNVRVVPGRAPEVLRDLPAPQRVFIGGSGGRLAEILDLVNEILPAGGRLVINAVTLETLARVLSLLQPPWSREIIQLAVTRGVRRGNYHLLQAANPVWIITAGRGGAEDEG